MTTTPADRSAAERVLQAVVDRAPTGSVLGTGPTLRGPGEWTWADGATATDYVLAWPEGPDLWALDTTLRDVAGPSVLLAPVSGSALVVMPF